MNVGDPLTPDDQDVWKFPDVFLVDLATGQRTLASSQDPTGFSSFYAPSLSADGTRVAFVGDLAGGPFLEEVFVRDAADALPLRASTSAAGVVANGIAISPRLAGDGLSVAFTSRASNLHPDDTDTADDVVLKDLTTGEVHLATLGDAKPAGAFGGSSPLLALGGVGGVLFSAPLALYDPAVTDPYAFGVFRRTFAPSGPVDADGDGVVDALQPAGTAAGAFVDASTVPATSGAVVDTGGLAVAVTDAEDPAEGVLVTVGPAGPGTTRATLSVCGLTVRLDAGSSAVLTCGSLVVRTLTGTVRVETDGGAVVVTVPAGASARVVDTAAGADVDEVSGTGVTVTVGGSTTALADGSGGSFVTWTVSGPGAPVDPQPVLNRVKAGRAVPLKWHVADASGAPVTTLTSASVSVRNLACGLATTTDEVEQTVAGGSGLQNLGGGYYQLNWKTSPAWAGSCKTMTLDLGGGAVLRADFQLSR
ncbi:PxKF domain-containing protein [Actinotalea sp. AC32]|nr:PxKF domain-containing protein [Actinotalea sp. AC32]